MDCCRDVKNGSSLDIRTIPAVIGGDEQQRKGIVLAKSNLAKQVGIKTGEPIYYARKNVLIYKFIKVILKHTKNIQKCCINYYWNIQIK